MDKLKLRKILKLHREWLNGPDTGERADLSNANLSFAELALADLSGANLIGANLSESNLNGADLYGAHLSMADLSHANLNGADLSLASLNGADLHSADLSLADLRYAFLQSTNFTGSNFLQTQFNFAKLSNTMFNDVDLLELIGLESCEHFGKSFIDTNSLIKSGNKLPQVFLRGIGLSDNFIDYLPSLSGSVIQYYSCFISYSKKDKLFAERMHNDLQNKGVRCWFAPEDMKIGDKVRDTIYEAIRIKDKLLVIMSEDSVNSDWVEEEVEKALADEKSQNKLILFPVRIDDEVMNTNRAWAEKIRNDRHIGDFRKWKEPEEYKKAFDRLLKDLKVNEV